MLTTLHWMVKAKYKSLYIIIFSLNFTFKMFMEKGTRNNYMTILTVLSLATRILNQFYFIFVLFNYSTTNYNILKQNLNITSVILQLVSHMKWHI